MTARRRFPPRPPLAAVLALALGALGLVTLGSAGCGAEPGKGPPGATATGASAPSIASPSPRVVSPAAGAWEPRVVLTAAEIAAIRRRLDAGAEPWASAWRAFLDDHVKEALDSAPSVPDGPYTGGEGDVHDAFLALDGDSRDARDFAIAFVLSGDLRYARAARAILVAWAKDATPTRLRHYDSPDTGQLQSWGAFSFAYAYDLTRGSGVYSDADTALVRAYFRRFTFALREALDRIAADPSLGTAMRRPYEWDPRLTYRYEDRIIGGNFSLAIQTALLALAIETGDRSTVAWVLSDPGNPLRADRAMYRALRPDNDGDGRGSRHVPEVAIMKGHREERGGTVDYMTYNARLATLLVEVARSEDPGLTREARPLLRRSWVYLSRFFGDEAVSSPNPGDQVDLVACLPRFVPAYEAVRAPRLLAVAASGDEAGYYEPQFLGPVTLTHWVTETAPPSSPGP